MTSDYSALQLVLKLRHKVTARGETTWTIRYAFSAPQNARSPPGKITGGSNISFLCKTTCIWARILRIRLADFAMSIIFNVTINVTRVTGLKNVAAATLSIVL